MRAEAAAPGRIDRRGQCVVVGTRGGSGRDGAGYGGAAGVQHEAARRFAGRARDASGGRWCYACAKAVMLLRVFIGTITSALTDGARAKEVMRSHENHSARSGSITNALPECSDG